MLDWYDNFIEEGKNRFLINFIMGLLLLGVFIALMCIPKTVVDSILTTPTRQRAFETMQDYGFAGILAIVGCGFFFIGLDLLREPDGFAWLVQKVVLGLGIIMIISSCAVGAVGYNTCQVVREEERDIFAAVFNAVPSCGFFAGVLSFAGYLGADEYSYSGLSDFLAKICPFITTISFIISYGINLLLSYF